MQRLVALLREQIAEGWRLDEMVKAKLEEFGYV